MDDKRVVPKGKGEQVRGTVEGGDGAPPPWLCCCRALGGSPGSSRKGSLEAAVTYPVSILSTALVTWGRSPIRASCVSAPRAVRKSASVTGLLFASENLKERVSY